MTGFIETIHSEVVAMRAELAQLRPLVERLLAGAASGAAQGAVQALGQPAALAQPQPAALAPASALASPAGLPGLGGPAAPAGLVPVQPTLGVTSDHITQLVMPMVENPAMKAALLEELRLMGIPELPQARPDQYGELYTRFVAIRDRFSAPQQAASPAPASIV